MKRYMFQYASDDGVFTKGYSLSDTRIIEDTGLITLKEAEELWEKHYPSVVRRLEEGKRPQMGIWENCKDARDYRDILREIDWRDELEIKDGRIYKKTLEAL